MHLILISLLLYAIPANLTGAVIHHFCRQRQRRLYPFEYLLIYLPYALILLLATVTFGSFAAAVEGAGFAQGTMIFFSIVAGLLGGLSLLPRLFIEEKKLSAKVLTPLSSFLMGTVYLKLIFLATLFSNSSGLFVTRPH